MTSTIAPETREKQSLSDWLNKHIESIASIGGLAFCLIFFTIMTQPKPNQQEKISFKVSGIREYFPRGYTASQMTRDILKGLELLRQQRQRNRDAR